MLHLLHLVHRTFLIAAPDALPLVEYIVGDAPVASVAGTLVPWVPFAMVLMAALRQLCNNLLQQ